MPSVRRGCSGAAAGGQRQRPPRSSEVAVADSPLQVGRSTAWSGMLRAEAAVGEAGAAGADEISRDTRGKFTTFPATPAAEARNAGAPASLVFKMASAATPRRLEALSAHMSSSKPPIAQQGAAASPIQSSTSAPGSASGRSGSGSAAAGAPEFTGVASDTARLIEEYAMRGMVVLGPGDLGVDPSIHQTVFEKEHIAVRTQVASTPTDFQGQF